MIEAYKKFWTNYFNFKDRSTRKDFWLVFLCNIIIGFILGTLVSFTKGVNPDGTYDMKNIFVILTSLYEIATLIPGLALDVRRMHDINKSGWSVLIVLVPFVGWIIWLVWLCRASVDNNKYGKTV